MLLHLCLMDGKAFRALEDKNSGPIPFHEALMMAENDEESVLCFENTSKPSNEGTIRMEVSGSIVLASHKNGLTDVAFDDFFSALLYELDIHDSPNAVIKFPIAVEGVRVPFLSPLNITQPSYLT